MAKQIKITKIQDLKLIIGLWMFLSFGISTFAQKSYNSWLPAPSADDAMLLGNGTMGAMVFGHPHSETIILNHSSLYLPTELPKEPINQASLLDEIRSLILAGNGVEAAKLPVEQSMKEGYGKQLWSDPYVPAFDLKIFISPENIENYQRSLDFETGVASVNWTQNGNSFVRKQFISRADCVMVVQIEAQQPFKAKFGFERRPVAWNQWDYINSTIKNTSYYSDDNKLFYSSEFVHQWEGNIGAYAGAGRVVSTDGKISTDDNYLVIDDATSVLFLLKVDSYLSGESINKEQLITDINKAPADFATLLDNQEKVHTELYNRVSIDLTPDEGLENLDTEVMMQEAKEVNQNEFVERLFYAARYNILSATGKNPPNLQGIWGSSWTPPWSSDYTHDGNLPTAISSYLMSNMSELMMSFFDYHDARIPYYKDNAKKLYNCRGIQIPSHTSSQGWNNHFDKTWCLTFWNGGAPWAAHYYYDYWLYTKDKEFLENRAYPFMEETALFFEDFLTPGDDGKYMFNPSYSPENNPANNPSQATINATMDVMLVKELLRNLISAGNTLGEEKQKIAKWSKMLELLPDYEMDSAGVLREWLWPGYQENHKHRHISQLYGLYHIVDPEIAASKELMEGARRAIEQRMKVRRQENGGIMVFGMVQMAWVAANLGDVEMVTEIINWLSSQYWSNSLASFHDPNGLFNMDLSGGYQAAILRTLIYSEPGELRLFPAKPIDWEQGSVKGIKARNQVTVESLSWTSDKASLIFNTPQKQQLNIIVPASFTSAKIVSGKAKMVSFSKNTGELVIDIKSSDNIEVELK